MRRHVDVVSGGGSTAPRRVIGGLWRGLPLHLATIHGVLAVPQAGAERSEGMEAIASFIAVVVVAPSRFALSPVAVVSETLVALVVLAFVAATWHNEKSELRE